eukprot:SM000002S05568  [mRNA]  locus=s2:940301:941179:+ [translate_table: standard]
MDKGDGRRTDRVKGSQESWLRNVDELCAAAHLATEACSVDHQWTLALLEDMASRGQTLHSLRAEAQKVKVAPMNQDEHGQENEEDELQDALLWSELMLVGSRAGHRAAMHSA